MFWDSDIGKTIETAAYSLYRKPNPALEAKIDAIVDMYAKLQQEDGYLSSWYQRVQPGLRWTNLRDCHELYCAGHLIEGAVAYFQATGKRKFLDVMRRYADHIGSMFGPEPDKRKGYCGHEEIELALVKLARATGERRYLDLAKYFIDERGRSPHYFDQEARARGADPKDFHFKTYEYNQSHKPVREQDKVVGHAVRAMYLYSGMADIATEYGDDSLRVALDRLWDDLNAKNLYVTGGLGPSKQNEGFTCDYDLPNELAYAETCAAVGLVFWSSRMLGMGPNARYADVMERALYNGSISGLSQEGSLFFYENPLSSRGDHHRWIWHRCPCCPPNVGRMVAAIGSYMYGLADDAIAVHLYGDSTARFEIGGRPVRLTQTSRYPWDGAVEITFDMETPTRFGVYLRIPGWSRSASLQRQRRRRSIWLTSPGTATRWWSANGKPATPCGWSSRWRSSALCAPRRRGRLSGAWRSCAVRWSIASKASTIPRRCIGSAARGRRAHAALPKMCSAESSCWRGRPRPSEPRTGPARSTEPSRLVSTPFR